MSDNLDDLTENEEEVLEWVATREDNNDVDVEEDIDWEALKEEEMLYDAMQDHQKDRMLNDIIDAIERTERNDLIRILVDNLSDVDLEQLYEDLCIDL